MPPRYEIGDRSIRNNEGSLEKEPTCKTGVLTVDPSQSCFLSRSMTISLWKRSEKVFHVVEDQIFRRISERVREFIELDYNASVVDERNEIHIAD